MPYPVSCDDSDNTAIHFVLGGKVKTLAGYDPAMTVLQYLRETGMRTGTKEACGEGGCGACTVVLVDPGEGDRLRYRSINACLLLLPQLDGQALLTVEDLKAVDGSLHPVQRALIDCHASQCGFCTPGIVMSLFVLYQSGEKPDRETIVNALAGNLCRCTGYRSIIDAALRMVDANHVGAVQGEHDVNHGLASYCTAAPDESGLHGLLSSIQRSNRRTPQGNTAAGEKVRCLVPVDLAELSDMLAQYAGAALLAGGTDIGPAIAESPQKFETIIYLGAVNALTGITVSDAHITIGAATTVAGAFPVIARYYPAFAELLLRFGSPAIRNLATFGGNIACRSPVSDIPPVLIALNSTLVLRAGSSQRTLPMEAFHAGDQNNALAPGEFIESILIPLPRDRSVFSAYKISKRHDCDIAAISAAFYMELEDKRIHKIRICYGGMAVHAKRAVHCENLLAGEPWTSDTVQSAAKALRKDFQPTSDMRASSAYRSLVAENLLRRFYLESTLGRGHVQVKAYQRAYG